MPHCTSPNKWTSGIYCWTVILFANMFWASLSSATELEIRIDNAPTNRVLIAMLFDSANTFVDLRDPVRIIALAPEASPPERILDLPSGEYALVIYQDDNGNGRLDKNFIGIPREPLGFSNRYWPQGRPTYTHAAFRLEEGEVKAIDLHLQSVFGEFGLLGVGVGVIVGSSPYRGSKEVTVQPIPAISYIGDRVQILGPTAQCGIMNWGDIRLAATTSYHFGAYDEDDSIYLQGLGNRDDTMMGGLAIQADLPDGIALSVGYEHDLLNRNCGGLGRIGMQRAFQRGILTASPKIGLNWLTSELAQTEYGVSEDQAIEGRPAYQPGDVVDFDVGVGFFVELHNSWRIIANGSVTFLPEALTQSPIVDQSLMFGGFLALNWIF